MPVLILAIGIGWPAFAATDGATPTATETVYRELSRDIPALYLVNGLFLAPDQVRTLLSLCAQARDAAAAAREQADRLCAQHAASLAAERERAAARFAQLARGDTPRKPSPTARRELESLRRGLRQIRQRARARLSPLVDRAYGLLTESQKQIITNYKPCFIPTQDFRNPERVGQAVGDTSVGERILSRLRRAPHARARAATDRALDGLVAYAMREYHLAYSEELEQELRADFSERLQAAHARARAMSDAEFELEKSALARNLLSLEGQSSDRHATPAVVRWKVKTYLLNPGLIPVLEQRLAQAR